MFEKRMKEINDRKVEIRSLLEGTEEVNLDELKAELVTIATEEKAMQEKRNVAASIETATVEVRTIEQPKGDNKMDIVQTEKELAEKRGKDLLEKRAVTVASSNLVLPKHTASDIKPTFNEVSSVIDRVNVLPLGGGESFEQPYLKGYGEGDYTAEGADFATADPVFDYAAIAKSKISAYSEDSEETIKLPAANYDGVVVNGITTALRKKVTKQILVGTGATNTFTGIFSAAATAIDPATDLGISVVNEKTLDEIIYSFGGDEDVEDTAVLILNKKDLKAFATLRSPQTLEKIYEVVNNGNSGTIDGVPFIINSVCKAVSDAANAVGTYAMAYGPLSNYTMAIFSPIDVQRSMDYKFKQGMVAHKGSMFAGGNVTAKNGFLRVKKVAGV